MGFLVTLLIFVVLTVISELLRPKPEIEDARPAGLGDFGFPTATEERVVPIVWGTIRIAGPNVVWYGDLREIPLVNKTRTGMFTKVRQVVGFRYHVGVQFALCRGFDALVRVDVNDREVFVGSQGAGTLLLDFPFLFSKNTSRAGDSPTNEGIFGNLTIYTGTTTQSPDPYLAQFQNISGATPRYSGTAYCVWEGGWLSNSTQIRPWAFEVRRIPNGLSLAEPRVNAASRASSAPFSAAGTGYVVGDILRVSGGVGTVAKLRVLEIGASGVVVAVSIQEGGSYTAIPSNPVATVAETGVGTGATFNLTYVTGPDASIPNVIYEILTNPEWGRKQPASSIDQGNFVAVAEVLRLEGNGWSGILDRPTRTGDVVRELERQMDGVLVFNWLIKKWQITLARADYVVANLPLIDDSVATKVLDYSRSTWADTANQVKVQFKSRARVYEGSYGLAQDTANVRVQGGRLVPSTATFPGVKDEALANAIAWRGLRVQSYPLSRARIEVDRSFYAILPGAVVAWTSERYGFIRLPMRVARVNLGTIQSNGIVLDLVQDVFLAAAGLYGIPPPPGGGIRSDNLLAFIKTTVFEAPRALTRRGGEGDDITRIWCGAERRGIESGFVIFYDTAATPDYVDSGAVYSLLHVCTLDVQRLRGALTIASMSITAQSAAEKTEILAAMTTGTAVEIGTDLRNLIRIGDEYMLVTSAVSGAGFTITLDTVYRAVADSVQGDHAALAEVWILHSGGGLTNASFDSGTVVDVKLQPFSRLGELVLTAISPTNLTMANRLRRAYPPGRISLNGSSEPTTASLEGSGSGDTLGITALLVRRDYRTVDEVIGRFTDAATLFADFPTANTVQHQLKVYNDPAGANTLLLTLAYQASGTFVVLRNAILRATDGVLPANLGYVARARHTVDAVVYESRVDLDWDAASTTALTGQVNLGALDQNEESNGYDNPITGTVLVTLSTALPAGGMEYRAPAGSGFWTAMTGGGTNWSFLLGDGIVFSIRHTCGSTVETFCSVAPPGGSTLAYAVLFKV